tara:strand:+ start:1131 stop:1610 length:480 start_codon:yes stop_codon:yes gene_type:complete
MAFKTDTIKLKLHTGSNPSGANGELAVVNNMLRHYTAGAWTNVTSIKKNYVISSNPSSDVALPSNAMWNDVLYVSTADFGSHALQLEGPQMYAEMVRIEIVNAGTTNLVVERDQTETFTANIPQLGLTNQTTFTLSPSQKAIVYDTGVTNVWQVLILSL